MEQECIDCHDNFAEVKKIDTNKYRCLTCDMMIIAQKEMITHCEGVKKQINFIAKKQNKVHLENSISGLIFIENPIENKKTTSFFNKYNYLVGIITNHLKIHVISIAPLTYNFLKSTDLKILRKALKHYNKKRR